MTFHEEAFCYYLCIYLNLIKIRLSWCQFDTAQTLLEWVNDKRTGGFIPNLHTEKPFLGTLLFLEQNSALTCRAMVFARSCTFVFLQHVQHSLGYSLSAQMSTEYIQTVLIQSKINLEQSQRTGHIMSAYWYFLSFSHCGNQLTLLASRRCKGVRKVQLALHVCTSSVWNCYCSPLNTE